MKNMRWLPVLATVLFASGCGVLLGLFLLTLFVDADVEASKSDVYMAHIPTVVQASTLMDEQALEATTLAPEEVLEQHDVSNGNAQQYTVDFPNKAWYFVQAGVFQTPEYAYPIEQQLKAKGLAWKMYDMNPSRLMVAGFCDIKHANELVKQWSALQIDLYAKEMEITMQPVVLYVTDEYSGEGNALGEKVLGFYELLAQSSYQLLKGNDGDLQQLQSQKADLLETIDRLLTIDENKQHPFLLNLKTQLETSPPIVKGDKQLGKHMQELLLSLLAISEIAQVK